MPRTDIVADTRIGPGLRSYIEFDARAEKLRRCPEFRAYLGQPARRARALATAEREPEPREMTAREGLEILAGAIACEG